MAGNACTLAVAVRFTRSTVFGGVICAIVTEGTNKNNKCNRPNGSVLWMSLLAGFTLCAGVYVRASILASIHDTLNSFLSI